MYREYCNGRYVIPLEILWGVNTHTLFSAKATLHQIDYKNNSVDEYNLLLLIISLLILNMTFPYKNA